VKGPSLCKPLEVPGGFFSGAGCRCLRSGHNRSNGRNHKDFPCCQQDQYSLISRQKEGFTGPGYTDRYQFLQTPDGLSMQSTRGSSLLECYAPFRSNFFTSLCKPRLQWHPFTWGALANLPCCLLHMPHTATTASAIIPFRGGTSFCKEVSFLKQAGYAIFTIGKAALDYLLRLALLYSGLPLRTV